MAAATVTEYQLDELLLLLAKTNVDKSVFGLPLAARLLTLKSYADTQQRFSIGISSHGRYIDKVTALKGNLTPRNRVLLYRWIRYPCANFLTRNITPIFMRNWKNYFLHPVFIVANRAEADVKTIDTFMARPEICRYFFLRFKYSVTRCLRLCVFNRGARIVGAKTNLLNTLYRRVFSPCLTKAVKNVLQMKP